MGGSHAGAEHDRTDRVRENQRHTKDCRPQPTPDLRVGAIEEFHRSRIRPEQRGLPRY